MIYCWWHNEITLVLILRQLNPVHKLQPTWLSFILILSSHLHQVWPGGLFPSDLPTKTLYTFPKSPMHATWLIKLILILIKCGTMYKAWNSSVCTFIKLPVTCSPPRIKIFSSAPCPKHHHWIFFPHWEINFHTHTHKYIQKISHFRSLTRVFKLNGNKNFLYLTCTYFLHDWNFYLLTLFPNIYTYQHLLRICNGTLSRAYHTLYIHTEYNMHIEK